MKLASIVCEVIKMRKESTNLDIILKIASTIQQLGYIEYLSLFSHALVQLSESANDMNKKEESEKWESRSVEVDELIAHDIKKRY